MDEISSTIRFSDNTLGEACGNYQWTVELMSEGSVVAWMLRSEVTITTRRMSTDWVLHFWNDGRVVIKGTNRPLTTEIPDDDVREMSMFFRKQGWDTFEVDPVLLDESQGFEFWLRMYQSGIIESDILQKHDQTEQSRLAEAYRIEQEEDANANS